MKNWFKKISLVVFILVIVLPLISYAQNTRLVPAPIDGLPGNQSSTVTSAVRDVIIRILLPIVGIIAVLFLVIGGFRYITSAGDTEAAENAKKIILNAIIGLIVVLLSYVIITIIIREISPIV